MDLFGNFILKCFNVFYPYKIHGKENLPKGPCIIVCNHFRAIDCGFVADIVNKNTYFLAKSELFKNKLFAKVLKRLGGVPINRGSVDVKAIKQCVGLLQNGSKLVIFPEGTRNKTGTDELQEIKGGTAFISIKSKVPIVPVIIRKKSKIFRITHMMVGKPFEFTEFYDKKPTSEDAASMEKIIRENMLSTQTELKQLLTKKPRKSKKEKKKC